MAETFEDLLLVRRVAGRYDEFAEKAGISVRALHDLRAGKVETPRRATVLALANALHVAPRRVQAALAASFAEKQ